jgi:hypothetical protein
MGVIIVQILCIHVCKWKNDVHSNIPGMGEEGNKGE